MIEGSPHSHQGIRNHHHTQYLVAHTYKKQSVKDTFVSSNNMVPDRGSVPIVLQDHPCRPLLCSIWFLCIAEVTELPLQVSLVSIFLIGLIKIPHQNLLCYPRL